MLDLYIGLDNLPDFIGGAIDTTCIDDPFYFPTAGKVSDFQVPKKRDSGFWGNWGTQ